MGKLKVVSCKLGTMPARLNFRNAYKFRRGQYVWYREVDRNDRANREWQLGKVWREDPLLISRE